MTEQINLDHSEEENSKLVLSICLAHQVTQCLPRVLGCDVMLVDVYEFFNSLLCEDIIGGTYNDAWPALLHVGTNKDECSCELLLAVLGNCSKAKQGVRSMHRLILQILLAKAN